MLGTLTDSITCPVCGEDNCVPSVVFKHAERYGGKWFNVNCLHCNKMLSGETKIIIKISSLKEAPEGTESDW